MSLTNVQVASGMAFRCKLRDAYLLPLHASCDLRNEGHCQDLIHIREEFGSQVCTRKWHKIR